jgi:hypothetical protein
MGIMDSLKTLDQNLERFRVPEGEASGRFFSSVEATADDIGNATTNTFTPVNLPNIGGDANGDGTGFGIPWVKIFAGIAVLVALNAFAGGAGEGITQ